MAGRHNRKCGWLGKKVCSDMAHLVLHPFQLVSSMTGHEKHKKLKRIWQHNPSFELVCLWIKNKMNIRNTKNIS